jgi:hypothetical protein
MGVTIGPTTSAGQSPVTGTPDDEDDDVKQADGAQPVSKRDEVPDPDTVVTMPLRIQVLDTGDGARPGDDGAPLRADGISGVGARSVDAGGAQAVLLDTASAYDQMGGVLEMQFQKLVKDTQGRMDELNHQIGEIDDRIKQCHDQIEKLNHLMQKLTELEPRLRDIIGADKDKNAAQEKTDFEHFLAAELKKDGIDLDPARVHELVDGLAKGGNAAAGLAAYIMVTIVNTDATTSPTDKSAQGERLAEIADKAESYAGADDKHQGEASAALVQALTPSSAPLTKDASDAAQNGVTVDGVTLSPGLMKACLATDDPKKAFVTVMDTLETSLSDNLNRINHEEAELRAQVRALERQMQAAGLDLQKEQAEVNRALNGNAKAKERIMTRVSKLLEDQMSVSEQARQIFADELSKALVSTADLIRASTEKDQPGAR